MLFEIRNYHFRPELLDAYREWASEAWVEIFSKVPGGLDSYLRRESKFAEAL